MKLEEETTHHLILKSVRSCKNCKHWMNYKNCINSPPKPKWWQDNLSAWTALSTCGQYQQNVVAQEASEILVLRRFDSEKVTLDEDLINVTQPQDDIEL